MPHDDLIAWWPLNGTWDEAEGRFTLTPLPTQEPPLSPALDFSETDSPLEGPPETPNLCYGPTGRDTENGAIGDPLVDPALHSPDLTDGLTLEAWFYKAGNNTGGVLFGWGDEAWSTPLLAVTDGYGFLNVRAGVTTSRVNANFGRPASGCWHHLALVIPPQASGEAHLWINGELATPESLSEVAGEPLTEGGIPLPDDLNSLFGSPFRVATWSRPESASHRLDELKVWGRALSAEEIGLRALQRGTGELCPHAHYAWEPGPLCRPLTPPHAPLTGPHTARVISADTIAWVIDAGEALEPRVEAECGAYLSALEENRDTVAGWWASFQYSFAAYLTQARHLPVLYEQWGGEGFMSAVRCGQTLSGEPLGGEPPETLTPLSRWVQPLREWWLPRQGTPQGSIQRGERVRTSASHNSLITWLRVDPPLSTGDELLLRDVWGNEAQVRFDEDESVSWALKLAQVGFMSDDPNKRALLSHFMGPGGDVDFSVYEGADFELINELSGEVAFTGQVEFLADATDGFGERVWALPFGELTASGRYYVRLRGVGRTPTFELSDLTQQRAALTHARGLTLNRCAPIEPEVSPWARGDVHAVYRASFPPDVHDYRDHSAEGWGVRDASGAFVQVSQFQVIAATAITEALPHVQGGWHDAGDFDRRPMHLDIVRDLAYAYLLQPAWFGDGELDLPLEERADGVPDVLNEALWGLEVYRTAQQVDGGVGTWLEATSHPLEADPGLDEQPYYLSLATRESSLVYARHAALLARACAQAGLTERAALLTQSAEEAWSYAHTAQPLTVSFEVGGEALTWTENPTLTPEKRLLAAVELALLVPEGPYLALLDEPEMSSAFSWLRGNLWWQKRVIDFTSIALSAEGDEGDEVLLPEGWASDAIASIESQAEGWLEGQASWPHGWLWYGADHRYVNNVSWGGGVYAPLRDVALAWQLTGDLRYRDAALMGVGYLTGANPQGRSLTTGLGWHRFVTALHLPSDVDGVAEVSPGVTLYGGNASLHYAAKTKVWGVSVDARTSPRFEGVHLTLMPPPWDNSALTEADVEAEVSATLPTWRRLIPHEHAMPQYMEFTVWETTGPALFTSLMLSNGAWALPAEARDEEAPLSAEALREHVWMMP